MSNLYTETLHMPGRRIKSDGWFPALRELLKSESSADLDESDGLFIGYGISSDALPYTFQDDYDGPAEELAFRSIVLENRYLKAVFLPELGGRLWSLFDKERNRDLILKNTAFLPCNLGIRNAWFAGGVEFNCGSRGHDAQTCSPRFAAVIDGETPVLRFYEFQRDRGVPFQYDCFLPEDSRFLYIRGRIWNRNREVVPMYWWSNIAMPEVRGSRVVVPADSVFTNRKRNGVPVLSKTAMPDGEGFDASYPCNFPFAKDHFYNIAENDRRYECLFFPDGSGFCHASTSRLRGRKLFVWGQSQGGRHWNRKLLGPGLDSYLELQAGLGRTQTECLPMPPRTAWEWLEAYGPIQMNPKQVFGNWKTAVAETTAELDRILPAEELEDMLKTTHDSIALVPGRTIFRGSGWGALEEARQGCRMTTHLEFGRPGPEQAEWVCLLTHGRMDDTPPKSFQTGGQWLDLLLRAEQNWKTQYHAALNCYHRNDFRRAEEHLDAISPDESSEKFIAYLRANLRRRENRPAETSEALKTCGKYTHDDASFLKEILKMQFELEDYDAILKLIAAAEPEIQKRPLIRFMKAAALAHTGKIEEAEAIFLAGGGLDIPDIREGENSTSGLWLCLREKQAEREGIPFHPEKEKVPPEFDLRISEC